MPVFRLFLPSILAMGLLALPGAAGADTLTNSTGYTFTYSLADALGDTSTGTAVKPLNRNTNIGLAVDAFDPSLGTLTGIRIELQVSLYSPQFILHDSWESPNSSVLQLWSFGVGFVLNNSSESGSFFNYGNADAPTGANYLIHTGDNDLGSFSASETLGKDLSLENYSLILTEGELPFNLFLSGDITIPQSHPLFPYLSASGAATASGTLSVVYSYEAVPEPAASFLVLTIGALIPLLKVCRRTR